ncbi:hypothetical protein [Corynebacterium sp. A21]|uniref:hypothetical protein n=1 Tax=Corynebacterium sp. A21 TaxID=3457318 RepID=UPI003FD6576F
MTAKTNVFQRRLNGNILKLVIVTAAILLVTMGWSMWSSDFSVVSVLIFLVCVVLSVWVLTMRVILTVGEKEVVVSVAGIFSERIPVADIDRVTPGPETGIKEGAGARFIGNDMGYLVGGSSVRISRSQQSFLVSVDSPEDVIQAIDAVTS